MSLMFLLSAAMLRAQVHTDKPEDSRNMISFTPVGFMVVYEQFDPCVGIDYEYIIDRERGIGLYVPLVLGYQGPEQNGILGPSYKHWAFYAAPGLRVHSPLGRSGKRKAFITGLSLLTGNMHMYHTAYGASAAHNETFNYALTGLATDNTLDFYNRHFVFGIDSRVGYVFEDHGWSRFFIHLGLHFGGRF